MATIPEALTVATQLHREGKLREAETIYRRILEAKPDQPDALHLLGVIAHQAGRHDAAVDHICRAIASKPENAAFHGNLGSVYDSLEKLDEAVACYRRALELDPSFADAHYNLGISLKQQEKLEEAADCFRRAIELKSDHVEAHNNLGIILTEQNEFLEAVGCFQRALAINPNLASAHRNLGNACSMLGRYDEARAHFHKAAELNPGHAGALHGAARSKRFSEADRTEIERMESLLAGEQLTGEDRCDLHFALGKVYDDCGEWELAFHHFRQANQLVDVSFNVEPVARGADALINTFDASLLAEKANLGHESDMPVFVLGMPRSGTTLVEQILASHRAVYGAGELMKIAKLAHSVAGQSGSDRPYPRCINDITSDSARRIAEGYLADLRELGGEARRVVDKTPTNFWHLGLIAILFPRARIIHCRRHPLDVCLSCYFQKFLSPILYSYDLHNLGVYYRQYERMMQHWETVLPLPILDVQYEELVRNQEQASRRLVDFCDLDWDPECLEFHKNPRLVRTASFWQVRQPIYNRSVDRWKHYERHLDPLKEAIGWPRHSGSG